MSTIKTGNFYKRISDKKLFKVYYTKTDIISLVEARHVNPCLSVMVIAVPFDTFLKDFTEPTELEKALL